MLKYVVLPFILSVNVLFTASWLLWDYQESDGFHHIAEEIRIRGIHHLRTIWGKSCNWIPLYISALCFS